MIRSLRHLSSVLLAATVSAAVPALGDTPPVDIKTWETTTDGVVLSLTQILPDQARAFCVNRGFPLGATEQYATSCVFMTVLRNDSAPGVVRFRLEDWTTDVTGEERPLPSVAEWL